ncbi:MAG: CehA/McbA family metallohydrolase [Clostridia bacterium]|nr:CehA/McbA family metallohydrolase [Clostridia bacterium]MDE7329241.1 CehA/McbA family metallohydrolase [Clostridia bacterium]
MDIFSTSIRILPKDNKSHMSVEFEVPSGLKSLIVATSYSPKYEYDEKKCIELIDRGLSTQDLSKPLTYEQKRRCVPLANHIAWSLEDSEKLLGTEHRHNPNQVHTVSEVFSSNGFIKTRIVGGKWKLIASINNIVTDYIDINIEVKGYDTYPQVDLSGDYGNDSANNDSEDGKRSWQRVEMHCHTVASDGDMQPEELVQNAIRRGYKAICVTDHNTVSNVKEVKRYGEKYGLVVAGGIEWTTFWGHLTVIGGNSDVKWLDIAPKNINACIIRAREKGDLVTLAHPKRIGSPLCAGCHNEFNITNWDYITSYEVWSHYNPSVSPGNKLAKNEWVSLLDKGYRICALYGYDWHSPDEGAPCYAYTYLGIDGRLTQDSVIAAVDCGRSYITMGYGVELTLSDGINTYTIGDCVETGRYKLSVKCERLADYPYKSELQKIVILSDIMQEAEFEYKEGATVEYTAVANKKGYIRVEGMGKVEGETSDVFIASPIYIKE